MCKAASAVAGGASSGKRCAKTALGVRRWPASKPAGKAAAWVPGGGAALPHRAPPSMGQAHQARVARRVAERGAMMDVVRSAVREAAAAAWAESTEANQSSAMRYWIEYCEVRQLDYASFGQLADDALGVSVGQLRREDEELASFAAYVVNYPRQAGKQYNSGNYAAQCISHVRSWYSTQPGVSPRRPGSGLWGGDDRLGSSLARVLKGMRKLHPSVVSKRKPVLLQHLERIRARLDLCGDGPQAQFERVMWAFVCTAWQGVRRSAELLSGKPGREWEPGRVMHRGRLRIVNVQREGGGQQEIVFCELPPSKTDTTGEKAFTMVLPIDRYARVNAGAALLAMLEGEPLAAGSKPSDAPLFRNPLTGKVLTYREAADWLKRMLVEIGEEELATGLHSLRLGGATTLASLNASAATMGMFGLWGTDAYLGYVWAGQDHVLDLSLQMAKSKVTLAPAKWSIR